MKKIFLLLAIGISTTTVTNAQWISGGPELGLNLANLSTMNNGVKGSNGIRPGLKIGGVLDIGFSDMFSIQPGLFYSMKGAHESYSESNTVGNITTVKDQKFDYRIDYLEVPVNFQFKFGNPDHGQFFAGAGPYLGFALGGRATNDNSTSVLRNNGTSTITDRNASYTLQIGNNAATDDIKPIDFGLNVNVGYEFPMGLLVRANYGAGLVNVMPGGDDNNYIRNWGFSLSAGYLFGH